MPHISYDLMSGNKFCTPGGSYRSPRNFRYPSTTVLGNKENANSNRSDEAQSSLTANLKQSEQKRFSPSSNEIYNAANRILAKRQSNSTSNHLSMSEGTNNNSANCSSYVKNIKMKFEGGACNENTVETSSLMTPKLIIKKFEALSKEQMISLSGTCAPITDSHLQATGSNLLLTSTSGSKLANTNNLIRKPSTNTSGINKTPVQTILPSHLAKGGGALTSSLFSNKENKEAAKNKEQESIVSNEHIKPKSIIEKFESLVKTNSAVATCLSNTGTKQNKIEFVPNKFALEPFVNEISNLVELENPNRLSSYAGTASLTYVSSMVSTRSSPVAIHDENVDQSGEDIYEELMINNSVQHLDVKLNTRKDIQQQTKDEYADYEMINETEQIDRDEIDDEPYDNDEEETSLFEQDTDLDYYRRKNENNQYIDDDQENIDLSSKKNRDSQETCSLSSSIASSLFSQPNVDDMADDACYDSANSIAINKKSNMALYNSASNNNNNKIIHDADTIEPLFSIKEYRKQKRGHVRRSSMAKPNAPVAPSNSSNKEPFKGYRNKLNSNEQRIEEEHKRTKSLERIKELEELIKQEDNIIHQTGIALERCLNEPQFTASSEHIECNRILLISCRLN
jgi:hypothetical protein